jgi:hypothetical protein
MGGDELAPRCVIFRDRPLGRIGALRPGRVGCALILVFVLVVVAPFSLRGAPATRVGVPPSVAAEPGKVVRGGAAQSPERKPARTRKIRKSKERKEAPVENRGIDTSAVWRAETEVFTPEQLVKLEPILRASKCRNDKVGCTYLDNGRPGSEASYAFRLLPWSVSKHRAYLVRNDRCGAGGCDEGLFVLIDGRWRLVTETFGVLARAPSSTLGFSDLIFRPRGQAPVRLVWDGRAYREDD